MLEHEVAQADKAKHNQEVLDAYKEIAGTPAGRLVINDLLRFCRVFEQSECVATPDGIRHTSEYDEGKRAVGMRLLIFTGKLKEMMQVIGV